MPARLLLLDDREFNPDAIINPEMAQHYLWKYRAMRDCNRIGDDEMSRMEGILSARAKQAKTIFNPFTGEIRHIDNNGDISEPISMFLRQRLGGR